MPAQAANLPGNDSQGLDREQSLEYKREIPDSSLTGRMGICASGGPSRSSGVAEAATIAFLTALTMGVQPCATIWHELERRASSADGHNVTT